MSDSTSPDTALQERIVRQIRETLVQIGRLAHEASSADEFHAALLPLVLEALAAPAGGIWQLAGEEGWQLAREQFLRPWAQRLKEQLEDAAREAWQQRKAVLLRIPAQDDQPGECIVAVPLGEPDVLQALLMVVVDRDAGPKVQEGYRSFLEQVRQLAAEFYRRQGLEQLKAESRRWQQLAAFADRVHRSLDLNETAYALVNETLALLDADRVTVLVRRGKHYRVKAVSGQDLFDPRSRLVRRLQRLGTAVARTARDFTYSGPEELPPQIQKPLQAFLEESHARGLWILPLVPPEEPEPPEETIKDTTVRKKRRKGQQLPEGLLVLEWFESTGPGEASRQLLPQVRKHAAVALGKSLEYQQLFLLPLWRALGRSWLVRKLRQLPVSLTVLALLAGTIGTLVLVPADFEIECPGTLEPVVQQRVFATDEGVVQQVLVEHGQEVRRGEKLLQLKDVDLEVQLADLSGQLLATEKRLEAVSAAILAGKHLSEVERNRLLAEQAQLRKTLDGLREQIALYRRKLEQLEIRSPLDGQVITWDVRRRLEHRPVARGQHLLTVADLSQDWELVLRLPDYRLGHVQQALAQQGDKLPVRFFLASEPEQTYRGELLAQAMELRADVHPQRPEEANVVLVRCRFDKSQVRFLRPGTTVRARIYCGRRSLGYVWFHDLWEFVQTRILFRLL